MGVPVIIGDHITAAVLTIVATITDHFTTTIICTFAPRMTSGMNSMTGERIIMTKRWNIATARNGTMLTMAGATTTT